MPRCKRPRVKAQYCAGPLIMPPAISFLPQYFSGYEIFLIAREKLNTLIPIDFQKKTAAATLVLTASQINGRIYYIFFETIYDIFPFLDEFILP